MPMHFKDRDVVSPLSGLNSALIVPCYMCPAVTVAVREGRPFLQGFRSLLKSLPFDDYLKDLQAGLAKDGITSKIFGAGFYHQWFMCMWTWRRRKKLAREAAKFDAVIVLGCGSATETVLEATKETDCKVVEGMEFTGIMNAKMTFRLPCNVVFDDCSVCTAAPIFGPEGALLKSHGHTPGNRREKSASAS